MKVVFFGTSDYCLPIVETLHKNFGLKLIVTRPDKLVGRKSILTPSDTKLWAIEHKIPVITPASLKKDAPDRLELQLKLDSISPDLAVVSDYGLIIPEKIFQMPKHGTLNIHFSRLPDLRGPSPVQFTLLRGDDEAWVTIFKLENPPELEIKMDSGPIIFQQPCPILPDDTTATLYTRLFTHAAKIIANTVNTIDDLPLKTQDHSKVTFCRFLFREDGFIEWKTLEKAVSYQQLAITELPKIQQEALKTKIQDSRFMNRESKSIYSFYRAVTPWPGVWTHYEGKRMKILRCHIEGDKLVLDEVQFEGKKPVSVINNLIPQNNIS